MRRPAGAPSEPATWAAAALLSLTAVLASTLHASAATTIDVRISVKVILNLVDGTRPSTRDLGQPYTPITNQNIFEMVNFANDSLMAGYWRGYRFAITEIVNVGSPCIPSCTSSNPSFWFSTEFDSAKMDQLETAAKANPAAYLWRTDAVNLYVNWGHGNGAIASFPLPAGGSNDVVVSGSRVWDPGFRAGFPGVILHHELGHYFNLRHTHAKDCCVPSSCIVDGDTIPDTLPDGPCFTLDSLSLWRYGQHFNATTPTKQDSLLKVWNNNMAYLHYDQRDGGPGEGYGFYFQTILTERQLDRWTDTVNDIRSGVRAARTRFVAPVSCAGCPPAVGSSTDPFRTLGTALAGAADGDILLLRPGTYSASPTISQHVTLRASHGGSASITNP